MRRCKAARRSTKLSPRGGRSKMYEPLYSATAGGPFGYRCKLPQRGAKPNTAEALVLCNRTTRTYKGIVMHCLRVHGLRAQMEMFDGEKERQRTADQRASELVRHAGAGREAERRDD